MHKAWKAPPVTTDAGVNLNKPLPRAAADAKRELVVEMMQAHWRRRRFAVKTRERYAKAIRDVTEAVEMDRLERQAKPPVRLGTPPELRPRITQAVRPSTVSLLGG